MKIPAAKETKVSLIHQRINKAPVNVESIEAMTPETDKRVTGTFINVETPGQPAKISGLYYKGMQYFSANLGDNETATIPLSVARFINERCFTEQHTHLLDAQGNQLKGGKKVPRYKFLIEAVA